jgi:hypothetical protein
MKHARYGHKLLAHAVLAIAGRNNHIRSRILECLLVGKIKERRRPVAPIIGRNFIG